MIRVIVLDSTPLGLLVQRPTVSLAEQCRIWLKGQLSLGVKVVVPEIVYYELRRELLRLQRHRAVDSLIEFIHGSIGRYLPITTSAMDLQQRYGPRRGNRESQRPIHTPWMSTSFSPPN